MTKVLDKISECYQAFINAKDKAVTATSRLQQNRNERGDLIRNHPTIESNEDYDLLVSKLETLAENALRWQTEISDAQTALISWYDSIPMKGIKFHVPALNGECRKEKGKIMFKSYAGGKENVIIVNRNDTPSTNSGQGLDADWS